MLEDERKGREMNGGAGSAKETSVLELLGRRFFAQRVAQILHVCRLSAKEESATKKTKFSNEEMKSHVSAQPS